MQKVINSMVVHTQGNKNNQPIVFVHGFPFDNSMWHNQINFLKDNFYCVSYDIRGLGESYVGDGQYTMEAFVEDLFSIITELNLNKPVLCGLSMGGYIALRATEKYEQKLSGLILLDTKADSDDDDGKLVRANKINQINVEGLDSFVDSFVPGLFCDETKTENVKLYESTIAKCKQNNPIGVKGALIAMLSRTSTVNYLSRIKLPVLVITGAFDKLTPPVQMRELADKIKNSEFAIAPRAGHLSPLENPGFVNDMIKGFLKRTLSV